jgi:hypothetical protein
MERAFCIQARQNGILSLAVCDFFGNSELKPIEAENICVINEFTREQLIKKGYFNHKIHVTGQPGMDGPAKAAREGSLRGFGSLKNFSQAHNYRIILASQPGKEGMKITKVIIEELGRIQLDCSKLKVRVTLHPSHTPKDEERIRRWSFKYGFMVCKGSSQNYFSWGDALVSGFSTALLEAAHAGLKSISVDCGQTRCMDNNIIQVCAPHELLHEFNCPAPVKSLNLPFCGSAAQKTADVIEKLLFSQKSN